jgi:hypothetical protein
MLTCCCTSRNGKASQFWTAVSKIEGHVTKSVHRKVDAVREAQENECIVQSSSDWGSSEAHQIIQVNMLDSR